MSTTDFFRIKDVYYDIDTITVDQMGKIFTTINMIGKYSNIDLTFETETLYKLDADLKYTGFDIPKSTFWEIRYHKENEVFQYLGVIQGGDENSVPVIKLQMYEGGVKLK